MNPKLRIPLNILQSLGSIFIVSELYKNRLEIVKFCSEIEKAHWHYIDVICLSDRRNIKCTLKEFTLIVFDYVPLLSRYRHEVHRILDEYQLYKQSIPTYGAILLSKDLKNVLLLQSYCSKGLWGFPKGKIEQKEDPLECAIREVYEETNVDISKLINPDWYVEGKWANSCVSGDSRLYIIPNVPMDMDFVAKTKNEIVTCRWFTLDDLFTAERGSDGRSGFKITSHAFSMTKHLKRFLISNKLR